MFFPYMNIIKIYHVNETYPLGSYYVICFKTLLVSDLKDLIIFNISDL